METKAIPFASRRVKSRKSKVQRRRGVRAMKKVHRQATSRLAVNVFAAVGHLEECQQHNWFVNNGVLVNTISLLPPFFDISIRKCGPRVCPYELCSPHIG